MNKLILSFGFFSSLSFLFGENINVTLITTFLSLIIHCFLHLFSKNNNVLFCLINLIFHLKYVIIPILYNIPFFKSTYNLTSNSNNLLSPILFVFVFILLFNFIGFFFSKKSGAISFLTYKPLQGVKLFLFFTMTIVGVALSYSELYNIIDASNRISYSQGKGFYNLFGFFGYGLAINYIIKYLQGKSNLLFVILICLFSGLFFAFKLQRGGAVYPLFFFVFLYLIYKNQFFKNIYLLIIGSGFSLLINNFSGYIRYYIVSSSKISYKSFLETYSSIPKQFDHISLINYFDPLALSEGFQTFYASLFNWIPKALHPEKPLTSGSYFAKYFFNWTDSFGNIESGITTGLIVDILFNFRSLFWFAAILLGLIFAMGFNKQKKSNYISIVLLVYLFGFNIFFDDLGGAINKFVLCLPIFIVLKNE